MKLHEYLPKKVVFVIIAVISVVFISLFLISAVNFSENKQELKSLLDASISPMRLPIAESVFYAEAKDNPDYMPIRNWNIEEPEISARAVIVLIPGKKKILFRKNIDERLPIASITKIMTAAIVLDSADLKESATVKYNNVTTEGRSDNLVVGEKLSLLNLIKIMLIPSNNDAAEVLAEMVGEKFQNSGNVLKSGRDFFIEKMNNKAVEWGMLNTEFSTPSGLQDDGNFSSANDVAVLSEKILNEYSVVWDISKILKTDVQDYSGWISHHLVNTNQLLFNFKNIIGGKTGYTDMAGGCIVVIEENPREGEYVIYVILGSENRFNDVEKLMNWVNKAYIW